MTITPEQFNQLATKDDLKDFVTKDYLDKRMDQVLNAVDGIAGQLDGIRQESKMDKVAHNRMQGEINQIKGHLGLKIIP